MYRTSRFSGTSPRSVWAAFAAEAKSPRCIDSRMRRTSASMRDVGGGSAEAAMETIETVSGRMSRVWPKKARTGRARLHSIAGPSQATGTDPLAVPYLLIRLEPPLFSFEAPGRLQANSARTDDGLRLDSLGSRNEHLATGIRDVVPDQLHR